MIDSERSITTARSISSCMGRLASNRRLNPIELLDVLREIIEEASRDPAAYQRWLPGALVVDLRRSKGSLLGIDVCFVSDDGPGFVDMLVCSVPSLSFQRLVRLVESMPELVGPAFVLVEPDAITLSTVTYVELEELDGRADNTNGDPDATLILTPAEVHKLRFDSATLV